MTCLTLLSVMIGCTKDQLPDSTQDSQVQAPDPQDVPLAGPCGLADDWGGFYVKSSPEPTDNGIDGRVADAIWPWSELEQIGQEGDCRLLRRNVPFCDPGCDVGKTCDFDGSCVPEPSNQNLGTATITGLVAPVEMEPAIGNIYYDTSLAYPVFSEGDLVTLSVAGGVYGDHTLYGVGVQDLESLDSEWLVQGGEDLVVRWDAPSGEVVRGEVDLFINIDVHGASPGSLYCTFQDDGEATVPAGILAQLTSAGVTGFPSGSLERRTYDSVQLEPGCFDFKVSSPVDVKVDVEGYTPCWTDEECPEGQECNEELQICQGLPD